jgi:hypothetical protein
MAGPKVRRLLEEIMAPSTWVVSTPFAREHFGRGKAEGRAEGWAEAILRVLAARKVEVPDDARTRILACTDTRQLDTWLDRAVTATDIADLFE